MNDLERIEAKRRAMMLGLESIVAALLAAAVGYRLAGWEGLLLIILLYLSFSAEARARYHVWSVNLDDVRRIAEDKETS